MEARFGVGVGFHHFIYWKHFFSVKPLTSHPRNTLPYFTLPQSSEGDSEHPHSLRLYIMPVDRNYPTSKEEDRIE